MKEQDNTSVPAHQNCGKLCTPNTLNNARQKAPLVAGSWFSWFDTCTAGIPLSPTLFVLSAALHRRCTKSFCGVAFPHVWVTLEGMCHCASLGTWVPIADTYCPVLLRITGSLVPKSYSQLCGYLGTWCLQRNLRGTDSVRRLHLQEACCYTLIRL